MNRRSFLGFLGVAPVALPMAASIETSAYPSAVIGRPGRLLIGKSGPSPLKSLAVQVDTVRFRDDVEKIVREACETVRRAQFETDCSDVDVIGLA